MSPLITIASGVGLLPAEVRAFDEAWMTPEARAARLDWATRVFTQPFEPGAWGVGEGMEAMARMFDLTHDLAYLDHLRDLARLVLDHRDDRRTDEPGRVDPFRGRVMPAWGAPSVASGYLHHTAVEIAAVYAYPIAAFARIVAEHPPLWAPNGADAVAFANATLETLRAFADEFRGPADDPESRYFVYPRGYRTLLTERRCEEAYEEARMGLGPDGWAATEAPERLRQLRRNCNVNRRLARDPVGHNQNHAAAMAMIEAWRAVDSAFYRRRVGRNALADWARAFLPVHVAGIHRWFARNARTPDGPGGRLSWHHADGVPDEFLRTEDTSHAELSVRSLGVLLRSLGRINGALPPGHGPIELGAIRRQLARTFLLRLAAGRDLAHTVDGGFGDRDHDAYDASCNGWLDLSDVEARVYDRCRDITLRVVDGAQPYLGIGNHASLLANKPPGPAPGQAIVPDVRDDSAAVAAAAIEAAGLVARFAGRGTWVESQSPRAGSAVPRGSTVTCGLRSGPVQ